MSGFRYVSASNPCPLCRAKTDCRTSGDLIFCHTNRNTSDYVPGHVNVGQSKDGTWGLWLPEHIANDPDRPRHSRRDHSHAHSRTCHHAHARPTTNAANLIPTMFERLRDESTSPPYSMATSAAEHLGLPYSSSQHWQFWEDLQSSTTPRSWGWTLPEWGFDDKGQFRPVSVLLRRGDGTKRNYGDIRVHDNPKRGLTLLHGYDKGDGGIIYIPEGASDCLALDAIGLTAIGRPSSRTGGETLARHIALSDGLRDRPIVVLAENDLKQKEGDPFPRWEGRDGARIVAQQLADRLGRAVRVGYVPEGAKDVRAWFHRHWHQEGDELAGLAERFEAGVCRAMEVYESRPEAERVATPTPTTPPDHAPSPATPSADPAIPEGVKYVLGSPQSVEDAVVDDLSAFGVLMRQAIHAQREADQKAQASQPPPSLVLTASEVAARIREARGHNGPFPRCPNPRRLILSDPATNRPFVLEVRCEHWDCPACRPWLIYREEQNAELRFRQAAHLFHVMLPDHQWDTFARRLRRAKANYRRQQYWHSDPGDPDAPAELWSIVIMDRRVMDAPPITAEAALDIIRTHFSHWHEDYNPCSTSRGWCRAREEREPQFERLGMVAPGTTRQEIEQIAADVGATVRAIRPTGHGDGRILRIFKFDRPDGWDIDTRDRLASNLMMGEVVPDLPDDIEFEWGVRAPHGTPATPLDRELTAAWVT